MSGVDTNATDVSVIHEGPPKHFAICIFNRATYSRCKSLINLISKKEGMSIDVVMSGALLKKEFGDSSYVKEQNPSVRFIELNVKDYDSSLVNSCLIASDILAKCSYIFSDRAYDGVIVVADRFETLPCATAAAYLNIPVFHIQGGEVTGNIDEKVRHAVTKLADYHLVATDCAREYVIAMGEDPLRVWNTGCPSLDVVREAGLIKRKLGAEKYIMCIFHPDTERIPVQKEQTEALLKAVIDFCAKYGVRCYWYWPNPDPGRQEIIDIVEKYHEAEPLYLIKAINKKPEDFLRQLSKSLFIIGNSSVGLRETSFMGVPSINVGLRQNLRERSWNVYDVDTVEVDALKHAMEFQLEHGTYNKSYLYGNGWASKYILKHIIDVTPTQKGPLKYPLLPKYRLNHLGESRFDAHKKSQTKENKTDRYSTAKRLATKRKKPESLQSQS